MRLIDADRFRSLLLVVRSISVERWTNFKTVRITDIIDSIIKALDSSPTIDPESLRPHGCWIRTETASWQVQYKCSCCGCKWPAYAQFFAYCPYCGSKMETGHNEG